VWLVGGKPKWYRGNHVQTRQRGTKFQNARTNIDAIIDSVGINDDFVLMNDDFFVLGPVAKLGYYYSGPLINKVKYFEAKHPDAKYTGLLRRSHDRLLELGVEDPKDYALHLPFKMNKRKLAEVLPLNMSWHLSYGNLHNVGGTKIITPPGTTKDVKVYLENDQLTDVSRNPLSRTFLSTEDRSFKLMKSQIESLFPDRSRYERTA
jgi:hypothetical protein